MPVCHMTPLCCGKSRAPHVLSKTLVCLPSEPHDGAVVARHCDTCQHVFEDLSFMVCTVRDLIINEQTMIDLIFVSFVCIFPLLMSFLNTSKINHKLVMCYSITGCHTNTGIYIWTNTIIH